MTQRTKPPFRADHVGSLLRPAALKQARERRARGEIGADELKAIEDREIKDVIKKQEAGDGMVKAQCRSPLSESLDRNRRDCRLHV